VRTASTGTSSDELTTSASDSLENAIRTYASKPGGPYRTRSHQSTSDRSNHRAASASGAGRISVTLMSLVQRNPGDQLHSHAADSARSCRMWFGCVALRAVHRQTRLNRECVGRSGSVSESESRTCSQDLGLACSRRSIGGLFMAQARLQRPRDVPLDRLPVRSDWATRNDHRRPIHRRPDASQRTHMPLTGASYRREYPHLLDMRTFGGIGWGRLRGGRRRP